ncbi:MAG: hypothetical protein V4519_04395 [Patescibacteria group bacterium]
MKSQRILGALATTLYFGHYLLTVTDWHFIDNANLIFHEAGHTIFFFLGEFIQVAMGSGFQIAVPLLCAAYFLSRRDFFSASILGAWVGQNIINVSLYAKDAVIMQLPLLGGDAAGHDWNYLLSETNLLQHTDAIAYGMQTLGALVILFSFAVMWYCAFNQKEQTNSAT